MAGVRITRVTGIGPRTDGSGRVATASRAVRDFHGVSVSGLGRLVIRQADSESLTITADDNILPYLTSQVTDGRLVLGIARNARLFPTRKMVYSLTVREIDQIEASGAVQVEADGVAGDRLQVRLSGAARVEASGKVERQVLSVSGAGRYRALHLASRVVAVELSGAAAARVRVSERLEGRVSGAATLEYTGDPVVAITGRGARRVEE